MQIQQWWKVGSIALLAALALSAASWWVGQRPYITPGDNQVFRMDSTPLASLGFLVLLAAASCAIAAAFLRQAGNPVVAARTRRISLGAVALYMIAVVVVPIFTPRTIVSIGDGYCYDLWCVGIQRVIATPQGQNIRYKIDLRIFSDANRVPTRREKGFLYALDDEGRRFPLAQDSSSVPADITVKPGESVKTSFTFLAPANARKLYLTGDHLAMPWVYLYLGSDIAPFHRRTLLHVL